MIACVTCKRSMEETDLKKEKLAESLCLILSNYMDEWGLRADKDYLQITPGSKESLILAEWVKLNKTTRAL